MRNARGQKDEALKLAKDAMDIELALSAPSGPPDPIKPAPEFYGELLLEAGRTRGSRCRARISLQRTPEPHALGQSHAAGESGGHRNAIITATRNLGQEQ